MARNKWSKKRNFEGATISIADGLIKIKVWKPDLNKYKTRNNSTNEIWNEEKLKQEDYFRVEINKLYTPELSDINLEAAKENATNYVKQRMSVLLETMNNL